MRPVPGHSLWLGHVGDTWDLRPALDAGIVALVDLALNEPTPRLPREMLYCRFPLVDGTDNPPWLLRAAVECLTSLLRDGVPTLVYCSVGLSRTPAVAAAALARLHGREPGACLNELTEGTPHDVAPGLWRDLVALFPRGRPDGA
jgi:protein-tyrosine phosphatase